MFCVCQGRTQIVQKGPQINTLPDTAHATTTMTTGNTVSQKHSVAV